MQFLYPTFLFALAALAIPIILHLFYFRRFKKVYFTNVRFLKEVKEETSARSKLRNLLVLAMRLLALAFLALAFAQPFLPAQDAEVKQGRKAVSVYIDNSFSLSQDVPLLDKARQRAREIVSAYGLEDQFQVLTNDFEGRHQRLVSQEDVLGLIDEIAISPATRPLSLVLGRQRQALNTGLSEIHVAYLISDFQRNIVDFAALRDTTMEINLVPLQAVRERNVSIDTAWFEAPTQLLNQTNALVARVKNHSNEAVDNVRLSLRHEGQTKPIRALSLAPGAAVYDTVNITILRTGWHEAELSVTDYPVQFDDTYFFTFLVAEEIPVLAIHEQAPNRYLTAAFASMPSFRLVHQDSRNLNYADFGNYRLIVLNNLRGVSSGLAFALRQFVNDGGNLLIFPHQEANIEEYRALLAAFPANELLRFEDQARVVGEVNTEEFVFRDVFENKSANLRLPSTKGNFRQSEFGVRKEERLLTYRDGASYLSKYQLGLGNLYLCAAPLDEELNDLARNGEIFIPMLNRMAISSRRSQQIAYVIGRDEVVEADHQTTSAEMVYKLKGPDEEFIPEQRIVGNKVYLSLGGEVMAAGIYDLFLQPQEVLARFAFNYDRAESDLSYYSPVELRAEAAGAYNVIEVADAATLSARIEARSQGTPLWRWCLILALLFLAAEALLLRFWRV
jgi:hypothetical protein